MTQEEGTNKYLVVVGMNRPKLNKIISLVDERRTNRGSLEKEGTPSVTVVSCLAAMGCYNDENGNPLRYLSNVVCHDGSSMIKYFDDESFRDNLDSVLLVGYEWQDKDDEKIKGYFLANQLDITVKCVDPNPEFQSLHDEMEAFKILDDETKEVCLTNGSMGPGKMAKAIIDAVYQIENSMTKETQQEMEEIARAEQPLQEADKGNPPSEEHNNVQREPPDPSRPRYACRICRTILFGETHLAQDHVQNLHSFKKAGSTPSALCQSLFCSDEVLQWLSPSGEDIEGRLTCPKCSHKIGHWKWAGAQCSCGTWVTPAIQIPSSKVDVIAPMRDTQPIASIVVGASNPQASSITAQ